MRIPRLAFSEILHLGEVLAIVGATVFAADSHSFWSHHFPPPGASQPVTYIKPGGSQTELQMTLAKCRMALQQTQLLTPPVPAATDFGGAVSQLGGALDSRDMQASFFQNCMVSNGWFPQTHSPKSQFSEEVKEALKTCHGADDKDKAIEWSKCYLFDEHSEAYIEFATEFHDGKTSHEDYVNSLKSADATWIEKIHERHAVQN
jgi:hypothetical protein